MENLKKALENLLSHAFQKASIYTTVIVVFTYHIVFDKDFSCKCEGHKFDCDVYMSVPTLIIFFVLLWVDNRFQRIWKFTCRNGCRKSKENFCSCLKNWSSCLKCKNCCSCLKCKKCCCCIFGWAFLHCFFKALLVSLLWPVSVLIDGDYYVCCREAELVHQVACGNQEDPGKVIADSKNHSRMWGLVFLCIVVVVASVLTTIPLSKDCFPLTLTAAEMFLEEGETLGPERLREEVKNRLRNKTESYFENDTANWSKCCEAADIIIIKELCDENSAASTSQSEPRKTDSLTQSSAQSSQSVTGGGGAAANQPPAEGGASSSADMEMKEIVTGGGGAAANQPPAEGGASSSAHVEDGSEETRPLESDK